MENEVEGNLLMEGVRMVRDSGEPDQRTKKAGAARENCFNNLLDPPSGLSPADLVWKGCVCKEDLYLNAKCRTTQNRTATQ